MEPVLQFHGFYRQLFSQSDVDNNLYGYVKSDLEEHGLCYALSGNWQRSDSRFGKYVLLPHAWLDDSPHVFRKFCLKLRSYSACFDF